MHKEDDLLYGVFQDFAADARSHLDAHPGEEELERFNAGSLPAERLEAVRDHLSVCPLCLADALDQRAFPVIEPPANAPRLNDDQIEERWRKFRPNLVAQANPEPRLVATPLVRRRLRQPAWIAIAAAATILLGIWSFRPIFSAWWGTGRPSVNAQIVSLLPEGSSSSAVTRGPEGGIQEVSLSPTAASVLLVLNVPSLAEFSTYRIDLTEGSEGRSRWSDSSIRPTARLSFTVSFPRSAMPAGRYLIQLWGGEGADLRLIATYRFRIADER